MNYYEELGLKHSATADEIHRAHRRLSKLLHPDQHTDEEVKVLAETQMRRLNAIVEVLSDPARRREYDQQLMADMLPISPVGPQGRWPKDVTRQRFTWHSVPWWLASTIGAVIITVAIAWYWADNLGSSLSQDNEVYVRPAQDVSAQAQPGSSSAASTAPEIANPSRTARSQQRQPPRATLAPSQSGQTSARIRQPISPAKLSGKAQTASKSQSPAEKKPESANYTTAKNQVSRVPIEAQEPMSGTPVASSAAPPASDNTPRFNERLANAQIARPPVPSVDVPPPPKLTASSPSRSETASVPLPALPNPAAPPKPSEPLTSAKTTTQHPLEGEWVYAPKEPEKRKPGFYPPEFIDLKLVWNEGGLHGQYRARYHVTDRPISPDVSFVVSPSDKESRKFVWQGNDGSRGTLRINPLDAQTIRVDWRTTVSGPVPGFTAGTATLVRRSP